MRKRRIYIFILLILMLSIGNTSVMADTEVDAETSDAMVEETDTDIEINKEIEEVVPEENTALDVEGNTADSSITLEEEESQTPIEESDEVKAERNYIQVEENTYIAYTLKDLKALASIPNAKIHFGNSIVWPKGYSSVNAIVMANGVTISGKDYYSDTIYTYTVDTQAASNQSFQIKNNGIAVRFEDITIEATGYYGIVNAGASRDAIVTYHNVTYQTTNGQPIHMPYNGKAILSGNCYFKQTNGGTLAQEFGQFTQLEFAPNSKVVIEHASNATAHGTNVFMYAGLLEYSHLSVTVGEGADVSIKTTKDFIRGSKSNDVLTLDIKQGAKFTLDQTDAVSNVQFVSSASKFRSNITVAEDATFQYQGRSLQPLLNIHRAGQFSIHKNATATVDNTGGGPAVYADTTTTRILVNESKLTRFSSLEKHPIRLFNNASGNVIATNQIVEASIDGKSYGNLGYVNTLALNQTYNNSSIVKVNPSNWSGINTFNNIKSEIKSLVFKKATLHIQEPVSNIDDTITVETYPNTVVTLTGTYTDGTTYQGTANSNSSGIATFHLNEKRLLAGSTVSGYITINNARVPSNIVIVQDFGVPETTMRRLEVKQNSTKEYIEEYLHSQLSVTGGTMTYDIAEVDSTKIGQYLLTVKVWKNDREMQTVKVPVFVYDDNCQISPFDPENPMTGTMVYAKNFESRSLDIKGDLLEFVRLGSDYKSWNEQGEVTTSPTVNIGDLKEYPLPKEYPITFTINGVTREIILTVTSENQMIDVTIPKKMLFGTLATTKDQKIYSPDYKIVNNGDTSISVYVSDFKETEKEDFTLVSNENAFDNTTNQAVLNLRERNALANISGLIPNMLEQQFMELVAKQEAIVYFDGVYHGQYEKVLQPKYKMILRFAYKKGEK